MPNVSNHPFHGVDSARGHEVTEGLFWAALHYLDCAWGKSEQGDHFAIWLSPRVRFALKMPERQAFETFDDIPIHVVDRIMDYYRAKKSKDVEMSERVKNPCRQCRMRGVKTEATVYVLGQLTLCQHCANDFPVDLSRVQTTVKLGAQCVRCSREITTNDNVAEQRALIGRFSGYCKHCWNSRNVEIAQPA